MKLTEKQTTKILKKLEDYGFHVTEPCTNGEYGVEVIAEEYFNEKVNEALEGDDLK